jgi:hypothetical protein
MYLVVVAPEERVLAKLLNRRTDLPAWFPQDAYKIAN